jgi:hypothetical protein
MGGIVRMKNQELNCQLSNNEQKWFDVVIGGCREKNKWFEENYVKTGSVMMSLMGVRARCLNMSTHICFNVFSAAFLTDNIPIICLIFLEPITEAGFKIISKSMTKNGWTVQDIYNEHCKQPTVRLCRIVAKPCKH